MVKLFMYMFLKDISDSVFVINFLLNFFFGGNWIENYIEVDCVVRMNVCRNKI